MGRIRPVLTTLNCFEIIPVDNVKSSVRVRKSGSGKGGKGKLWLLPR